MCRNIDGVAYPVPCTLAANIGIILAGFLRVGTADIEDLAVTTAKINNLAIETLKIKDQAVTLMVAAFTAGQLYYEDYAWHQAQTITMVTTGAPVALWAAIQWKNAGDNGCDIRIQRDNSSNVYSANMASVAQLGNPFCVAVVDPSPSAASHTYDLDIKTTDLTVGQEYIQFKNRSLVGQEVKK
jgi:hypothetical protein